MKCKVCGKEVETTFLKKLVGTYIKDEKGKRHPVCTDCQKTKTAEQIKESL